MLFDVIKLAPGCSFLERSSAGNLLNSSTVPVAYKPINFASLSDSFFVLFPKLLKLWSSECKYGRCNAAFWARKLPDLSGEKQLDRLGVCGIAVLNNYLRPRACCLQLKLLLETLTKQWLSFNRTSHNNGRADKITLRIKKIRMFLTSWQWPDVPFMF